MLLTNTTPVLYSCVAATPAVNVLCAPATKLVIGAALVQPVSVLPDLPVNAINSLSIITMPDSFGKLVASVSAIEFCAAVMEFCNIPLALSLMTSYLTGKLPVRM